MLTTVILVRRRNDSGLTEDEPADGAFKAFGIICRDGMCGLGHDFETAVRKDVVHHSICGIR